MSLRPSGSPPQLHDTRTTNKAAAHPTSLESDAMTETLDPRVATFGRGVEALWASTGDAGRCRHWIVSQIEFFR